jgi:hypothetical protein
MTDLDLTTYKALSFDCYGTLIDWEAGIAAVLAPWASEQGLGVTDEELLLAYSDNEAAVEQQTPPRSIPTSWPPPSAALETSSAIRSATSGRSGSASRSRTGRRSPTPPARWPGWPGTTS